MEVHVLKRIPSLILPLLLLAGCIEESSNPVVFDQVIESTTFTNHLLSPIVLYRNGITLDTLQSRSSQRYAIGAKGIFRHSWKLISPRNPTGARYGIEPIVELGIQYNINDQIDIRNSANGRTIFTPRVLNASFRRVGISWVNLFEADERQVGILLEPNQGTDLLNAPYYYWIANSNVVIEEIGGFRRWIASRRDTNSDGEPQLQITDEPGLGGSGASNPIVVF